MGKATTHVTRYAAAAVVVWTAIAAGSLAWNVVNEREQALVLATNTARANFNKDQAYRLWASSHGGVYVEPTERTRPSPYMAHLPERDLVTASGRRLTLMNPASMLREMMEDYSELYGIRGKITARQVLNPVNTADPWELDAIDAFERGREEVIALADVDGVPHLRLMRPMVVREDCLKCHGHQGLEVGEVHGGVGVAVPMASYYAVQAEAIRTMWTSHGGIWLLGLAGIGGISRRSWLRMVERERTLEELHLAASVFENGLDGTLITDPGGAIVRVNNAFSEITGFSPAESVGKTPRILRSEHHRPAFYAEMWQRLAATGRWQGEVWNRRKDGETFVVWQNISAVRDGGGRVSHYIGSFRDITQQKQAEAHVQHLAHYDVLTDLPNRSLFQDRLGHAVERARREGTDLAVMFLDLDRFKSVNDTLGHLKGDRLLQAVAVRLRGCLRRDDTVARLGGDEFVVLLEDAGSAAVVQQAAEKLLAQFRQPITLGEQELFIGASIGISLFPQDGDSGELLLRNADTAMYRAKETGRNRFYFYDPAMSRLAVERLALETAMRHALDGDELFLAYQPQLDLRSRRMAGVEALVRWRHPQEGLLPPDRFVPLAEETGLILPLGQRVLQQACESGARWQRELGRPLRVAVNVSGRQLWESDFPGHLREALRDSGLAPARLEVELTESVLMGHSDEALDALRELKGLGISLSIDDFGTGYSSLAYLKHLPVDRLKIDRSFISHAPSDPGDAAIAGTIITLSKSLGLEVVAEGVENRAAIEFATRRRCDLAQGYFIAEPLEQRQVAAFVSGGWA